MPSLASLHGRLNDAVMKKLLKGLLRKALAHERLRSVSALLRTTGSMRQNPEITMNTATASRPQTERYSR